MLKENLQATVEGWSRRTRSCRQRTKSSSPRTKSCRARTRLHSVNEELYTVNADQKKNAELLALNDDIEHLLNGTDVATMFLDRELCIRRFTPRIAEIFQVIPHDVGRPLASHAQLAHPTLMADIERVLAAPRSSRRRPRTARAATSSASSRIADAPLRTAITHRPRRRSARGRTASCSP